MPEETHENNGSGAANAPPASNGADRSKSADRKASKSGSPSKDKGQSAAGSDAPTKTSKKRRKVNHGKAVLLCALDSVNGLADPERTFQRAYTADVR